MPLALSARDVAPVLSERAASLPLPAANVQPRRSVGFGAEQHGAWQSERLGGSAQSAGHRKGSWVGLSDAVCEAAPRANPGSAASHRTGEVSRQCTLIFKTRNY